MQSYKTLALLPKKSNKNKKAITTLEQNLKEEKQALLKLTDEDLPSAMAEMNLSSFRLANGSEVSVKNTYGAHIKKKKTRVRLSIGYVGTGMET